MTKGALHARLTERLLKLERALVPMNVAAGLSRYQAERKLEHLVVVAKKRVAKGLKPLNSTNVFWAYIQLARRAQKADMPVATDMLLGLAEFHWMRLGVEVIPDWHPLAKWMTRIEELSGGPN